MKIMMFNGLLFLLFMWTSAEMGPDTEDTEGLHDYANENRIDFQPRKRACDNLSGKCIKKKKDCPSRLSLETKPGKPYCSKNHRCCYPDTSSCNLVWNYKEERPLIMIRESKTIVPPVTDIDISPDPNRIPIGRKLIFACPGENNQFNHVSGMHTKLHGECISKDTFKVCVNNNPEYLDLSQLSCSSRMFPSFIKDNDTSDKKSCDGIGGKLYKTGYTYGDYHEFKDLEIEVCFHEKNESTICTSPNLNGNETDYKTSRGFLTGTTEGKVLRMIQNKGGSSSSSSTACGVKCVKPLKNTEIEAKCGVYKPKPYGSLNSLWCYVGNPKEAFPRDCAKHYIYDTMTLSASPCIDFKGVNWECGHYERTFVNDNGKEIKWKPHFTWCYIKENQRGYCQNPCYIVNDNFKKKHVCTTCNSNTQEKDIDVFINIARPADSTLVDKKPINVSTVFENVKGEDFELERIYFKGEYKDVCVMKEKKSAWLCKAYKDKKDMKRKWNPCKRVNNCAGVYSIASGHFYSHLC